MIYLLSGKEIYLLVKRRKEIIEKTGAAAENITVFDASNPKFNIENAIAACSTFSLFSDRRVVVLDDPWFLNPNRKGTDKAAKAKKNTGDNASILASSLQNPNPDCDLIFYCDGFAADQRTREYKLMKPLIDKGLISEYSVKTYKAWEMLKVLDDRLKARHLRVDEDAKQELLLRIDGSLSQLEQTLDKLELYGKGTYSLEDIEHLTSINTEQLIWKLCNAMSAGSARDTIRYYHQLTSLTETSVQQLIASMAMVFRRMYISLRCYEKGMPDEMIRTQYGIRFPDLDRRSAGGKRSRYYLQLLVELADVDQGIKNGTIANGNLALEQVLWRHL